MPVMTHEERQKRRDYVRSLFEENEDMTPELASTLSDLSAATCAQIRMSANVGSAVRPRRSTELTVEIIGTLCKTDGKCRAVADQHKCSEQTVRKIYAMAVLAGIPVQSRPGLQKHVAQLQVTRSQRQQPAQPAKRAGGKGG